MSELDGVKLSMEELEAGLTEITQAPKDGGVVRLIAIRPDFDQRELPDSVEVTVDDGVVGDNWKTRGSSSMPDKSANPEAKITLMNSRVIDLITQDQERWQWAGDQFYVDFDISEENLPPGTQVRVGTAVLETSALPHTGCAKFVARFGKDAHKFVNNEQGRELRLRGVNMRVVEGGTVRIGDVVEKLRTPEA